MANVVLNVYTAAFPLITTNSLKYVVYLQSDPLVEVTSQTFAAPHAARTVSFPGLERANYIWKLIEMNGGTPVRTIGSFNVVPENDTDVTYYEPKEIIADITTGLTSGTNTFTFDGTGGTEDWRGREIYVERVGQGTMQKNAQYSWDSVTGVFTLLETGDVFGVNERFNVEFGIVVSTNSGGVIEPIFFKGIIAVTGTTSLVSGDAGKKILINGASPYFVVTLPSLATTAALKPFFFETGIGSHINVRIQCDGSDEIDWGKGARTNIKMGVCESIAIYKYDGKWRVHDAKGNFLTVGRIITTDADSVDEFNCVLMDGSSLSVDSYARLYEDFVLNLPPSQVCNFGDHGTGDNKYKFSFSSGGLFKIPDRRNLFERNSDGAALPGAYSEDKVGPISGSATVTKGYGYTGGPNNAIFGNGYNNSASIAHTISIATGNTETVPKHYVTRKYILI